MLSDQDILERYLVKRPQFEKQAEVTLLGHSLFDMWSDIENGAEEKALGGKTVANLGISGVSTRQYLDVIVKPQRIKYLGKTVFIFLGVNDIVKEEDYSPSRVMEQLIEIIAYCKLIAPDSRYFLLEATPVNRIATVDNPAILALNKHLQAHCPQGLNFIKTYQSFTDREGMLDRTLCTDGLHFNRHGYAVLSQLLRQYI